MIRKTQIERSKETQWRKGLTKEFFKERQKKGTHLIKYNNKKQMTNKPQKERTLQTRKSKDLPFIPFFYVKFG